MYTEEERKQKHKESQFKWIRKNIEKLKIYWASYFKKTRKERYKSTNNWRHNLTPDQKITGYSDTTLKSFSKDKLIAIIRELEK